jgi:hypothetical protein
MAKKSIAALSVVTPLNARPDPPDYLPDEQKAIWRAVVATKPADWFTQDVQPLLMQYCRHSARAAQLARMVENAESADLRALIAEGAERDDDPRAVFEMWGAAVAKVMGLMAAEKQQSAILKVLATAMRITPQARYTPQAAGTAADKTKPGAKPWEFGNDSGPRNIAWIESVCRVPEGKFVGKPVVLRPWQKKIIRGIYDTPTRRAIISFGRKNGKTALAAFLLLLHLCGPEARPNSQLNSAAQSKEQAAVLFKLAAKIVRLSPELQASSSSATPSRNCSARSSGRCTARSRRTRARRTGCRQCSLCMTSSGRSRVRDRNSMTRSRPLPGRTMIRSRSSFRRRRRPMRTCCRCSSTTPRAGAIRRSSCSCTRLTRYWTRFRTGDQAGEPGVWRLPQRSRDAGHGGVARRMPSQESSFRNLVLNQRVSQTSPFIPQRVWEACCGRCGRDVFLPLAGLSRPRPVGSERPDRPGDGGEGRRRRGTARSSSSRRRPG